MDFDKYKFLSPFELRNNLKKIAKESVLKKQKEGKSAFVINAGRGNPNFLNTTVRQAFSQLNLFMADLTKSDISDLGFRAKEEGIAKKFYQFLKQNEKKEGVEFLKNAISFALEKFRFDPDNFIFSLGDACLGDYYPSPPRVLPFAETILIQYAKEVFNLSHLSEFDVFPTEGGAAAMVYLFNSLKINKLLKPKDSIAIITPIFSPYLEMPELKEYDLVEILLESKEEEKWQISDSELKKLEDFKVKMLFIVNPANPSSYSLNDHVVSKIKDFVNSKRPDLMIVLDNVYATFVEKFHSLVKELSENTICVYSFSKYFGVTGWRLGFIMMGKDNIIDKKLPSLEADERYKIVALEDGRLPFIERLQLDSRSVSLSHTGGLGTPQQAMMALLAIYEMLHGKEYGKNIHALLKKRHQIFYQNLSFPAEDDKDSTHYYILLDMLKVAQHKYGKAFVSYLEKEVDPLDFLFKLAQDKCSVILPGSGFAAPKWYFRISLANLDDEAYALLGKNIADVLQSFFNRYDAKHY